MIRTSRLSATRILGIGLLLAISPASQNCWAVITFIGDCPGCDPPNTASTDFNVAANWDDPNSFPSVEESFYIQNTRTATFSSGSTLLGGLTVANDSFGRLRMTGGSLTLQNNSETLEVGRERFPRPKQGDYDNNGFVDGADFLIWQRTLGGDVLIPGDGADGDESGLVDEGDLEFWKDHFGLVTKGGEIIMTGSSTLTTNGAVIGRRSKGFLSVGPMALVDVKGPQFGALGGDVRRKDLEVGVYGPAYISIENEPGLEADGLVVVEGTVNANKLLINTFGAKGEFRLLPGGRVNLNGGLQMSRCDTQFFPDGCGLIENPQPLMSSKLSIIGSGGTFNVGKFENGLSPEANTDFDPPTRRDIRAGFPANATISFTADAGGVTPIVLVDNPGAELDGTVYLDGTVGHEPGTYAGINLELNLDAYTGASPLTLIDAPPAHLVGVFGTVTFLGSRTATVNYDYVNGNVFLNNFQNGTVTGTLAASAVPEPSGLAIMTLMLSLLMCVRIQR
jgi:hypothetical protein